MTEIGPVQLVSIGFEPEANFEGRIVDELAALENERTIRILDLLFIARDTDSDEIVVVEHQGTESMGGIVGALLGFEFDDDIAQPAAAARADEHSFGFSQADIEQMGAGLEPGGSAGLLLIEHVWARGLRRAVRDAGGRLLGEGFLTPEAIAAVEPELAAISKAIEEMEKEAANA
ncbi:MAG: hypothetical protein ACRDSN_22400 [Pseudonocardiaceae bacterium]